VAQTYALHEGSFGRALVFELRDDLVPHAHADSQLALWLGGARAESRVGSGVVGYGENVALGVNAYESHDVHLLDQSGPAVFLVLYLSKPWLDSRRAATGRSFFFSSPAVTVSASVRQGCWRVLDAIVAPLDGSHAAVDVEVEQLLLAAIASTQQPTEDMTLLNPNRAVLDHRLRAAIAYMREHVAEPLAVEEIASKVGLSRGHFFALFRQQLNTTPQVFWSAVRVEEVARRLAQQDASLTEVALDLGFSSPGNFSRFFREHMGTTPSRYRQAAIGATQHLLTGVP
jgi:AraC-like DNA-binding protein